MSLALYHGQYETPATRAWGAGPYKLDSAAVVACDDFVLYAVLDGVGPPFLIQRLNVLIANVLCAEIRISPSATPAEVQAAIGRALVRANEMVIDQALSAATEGFSADVGLSIVLAIWPRSSQLFVANLGDVRAFLFRGGRLEQLTVTQSVGQALYEAGVINLEESTVSPWRNVNWWYLGSREVREDLDVKVIPIQPGDRFLLASPMLTRAIPEDGLSACMLQKECPPFCATALCQHALDGGSKGNLTCIVIDALPSDSNRRTPATQRLARRYKPAKIVPLPFTMRSWKLVRSIGLLTFGAARIHLIARSLRPCSGTSVAGRASEMPAHRTTHRRAPDNCLDKYCYTD
jgi:protein phosphatase